MNVLDKILKEIKSLKAKQDSKNQDYCTGYLSALSTVEGIISSMDNDEDVKDNWIPASNPPKSGEYVLLSFSNFPLPDVGIYREDEDGNGSYYIGDSDESCLNHGIIVNGWMPLPKNMED